MNSEEDGVAEGQDTGGIEGPSEGEVGGGAVVHGGEVL